MPELLQERARSVIGELTTCVEELVGPADVCFRLLHGEEIQKREGLPEMMICTEPTNGTG